LWFSEAEGGLHPPKIILISLGLEIREPKVYCRLRVPLLRSMFAFSKWIRFSEAEGGLSSAQDCDSVDSPHIIATKNTLLLL